MKHALIVDDQAFNRETTRLTLEALGYEITEAASGEEAVKIFEQSPEKFQLITMDYNMPGMDGVETIQHIRKINQKVNIIGISAAASTMRKLLKESHIPVLRKPLNKSEFELFVKEFELE